jgi:diacylglycerol kinase family enzyme
MTAFIIFNPNSAGGDTGRDWEEIEAALERIFPVMTFFVTSGPAQAAQMVRDALQDGHLEIVAVGGDGTINEALNGMFAAGRAVSPEAVFSFVHNGDTALVCRALGVAPGWRASLARLGRARIRKADIGRVICLSENGAPVTRYFLAGASLGLSASIARAMGRARIARFFGTAFLRGFHTLASLRRWRGCHVRLMADGYDEIAGIASVRVVPQGGQLELAVAGGAGRRRVLRQLREPAGLRLRSGQLTAAPTLDTEGRVDVETDGESAGILPASFDILPGALNLRL